MSRYHLPSYCTCRRTGAVPINHYFIYVIELDAKNLLGSPGHSRRGTVYIGQSWHTPECRFNQHKLGYKASWRPQYYGLRLLPKLYAHLNPLHSRTEAESTEARLAGELKKKGYEVFAGYESPTDLIR